MDSEFISRNSLRAPTRGNEIPANFEPKTDYFEQQQSSRDAAPPEKKQWRRTASSCEAASSSAPRGPSLTRAGAGGAKAPHDDVASASNAAIRGRRAIPMDFIASTARRGRGLWVYGRRAYTAVGALP